MTMHLNFDRISELAEPGQSAAAAAESMHLAECDDCRATLRRVRELVAVARVLPRDVAPPPDVWAAVRARVDAAHRPRPMRLLTGGWVAAAAALVLVVGMSLLLPFDPGGRAKGKGATFAEPMPAAALSVERSYSPTVAELRETLDARWTTLSPATTRVVESSLAAIDAAIAEARTAMVSDPRNPALVEILSAHYARKVDLLQRATELEPSL